MQRASHLTPSPRWVIATFTNLIMIGCMHIPNFWSIYSSSLNWHVSICGQSNCPRMTMDVHVWERKYHIATSKATTPQLQLKMFISHARQPPYLCSLAICCTWYWRVQFVQFHAYIQIYLNPSFEHIFLGTC